jgi:dipeptidyl aminopeptidase/acylaminoacyl peptidase
VPGYNEIFIHNLKTGKERQLTAYKRAIDEISWATNNQIFFTSSRGGSTDIWMIPAKGGEAVRVTKGTGPAVGVRVSADGKRLSYLESRTINDLWSADIDGTHARQLTFEKQALGTPCFSPDNKQISYVVWSPDINPTSSVFVMQSDGTNRTQLTSGDAVCFNTVWSPDGKYIAYSSHRMDEPYDSSRVYLIDVTNPGSPRVIGKGDRLIWINAEVLLATDPEHPRSILYSIHESRPIGVSRDTTYQSPLSSGKDTLVWDMRSGREGWWLKAGGSGQTVAPKRLVSIENSAYPSVSLRYLLYEQENGEMWRISLPDGKRIRLPAVFDHTNPGNGEIQLSYDDKHVVYLKKQFESRLVLIENLFK